MKVAARVLDFQSNMEGERVAMSIDQSALAHIMGVLTDLYSDPELAVIREYSTNAWDAHQEAGTTRPIEVQLPTSLSPFLKIRDYGEGLDAADIRDIYSRYGTSTKRDSNDVVGMLGLGCKSALTYTDQFTLSGIKNGECVQVSVSRDENGAGSMTLVAHYETDDPSGVEVIIPAKTHNEFESKAADFFRFWTPGTVLVNGKEPKRIDGLWVSDKLLMTQDTSEDYIVMGNVAYPAEGLSEDRYSRYHVVAFVGIGEVQFTPSREALQMTSATKATIAEQKALFEAQRDTALEALVEEAESYADAIRVTNKVKSMGLKTTPKYRDEVVPDKFDFSVTVTEAVTDNDTGKLTNVKKLEKRLGVVVKAVKEQYRRDKGWETVSWVPSTMIDSMWVTGYDSDQFTPYKRQKLEVYCAENDIKRARKENRGYGASPQVIPDGAVTEFIFVRELPEQNRHWIDPKNVIQWADIKAIKIEKENKVNGSGRLTGSYDAFVAGQSEGEIPASDLKTGNLFWANSSVRTSWGGHPKPDGLDALLKLHPDATVVTMQANRIEKFKRDFPTSQNITEYLRGKAVEWEKSVSERDKLTYVVLHDYSYGGMLKGLDADQVDDPEIKALIKLSTRSIATLENEIRRWSHFVRLNTTTAAAKFTATVEKYPLLGYLTRVDHRGRNDLYVYLNAAYAARKEV